MGYSEGLANRVRTHLEHRVEIDERAMFGGLGFMHGGNLVSAVHGDALITRVGQAAYEDALAHSYAREMDLSGRPLRGFVVVDPEGTATDDALVDWLDRCLAFATSLPAKDSVQPASSCPAATDIAHGGCRSCLACRANLL